MNVYEIKYLTNPGSSFVGKINALAATMADALEMLAGERPSAVPQSCVLITEEVLVASSDGQKCD